MERPLALAHHPYWLVAVQILDGITASVFAVTVPLVVADITRGTGRFNLSLGIGASLGTTLAGYISDHLGSATAFVCLAGIAAAGLALAWGRMPETGPAERGEGHRK